MVTKSVIIFVYSVWVDFINYKFNDNKRGFDLKLRISNVSCILFMVLFFIFVIYYVHTAIYSLFISCECVKCVEWLSPSITLNQKINFTVLMFLSLQFQFKYGTSTYWKTMLFLWWKHNINSFCIGNGNKSLIKEENSQFTGNPIL